MSGKIYTPAVLLPRRAIG